jgi:rRNA maturation endonuclease Nob1
MIGVFSVILYAVALFLLVYFIARQCNIKKIVCLRCKKVYSVHKSVPDKGCPYCGVKI